MLKEPLRTWVDDLANDVIVVGGGITREAELNLLRFSISLEMAALIGTQDLTQFMEDVIRTRSRQLAKIGAHMMIYFWFDEMAGTLCSSLASVGQFSSLPFRGPISQCRSLQEIASQVLCSEYLQGIPWSELSDEAEASEPETDSQSQNVLDVFALVIP